MIEKRIKNCNQERISSTLWESLSNIGYGNLKAGNFGKNIYSTIK